MFIILFILSYFIIGSIIISLLEKYERSVMKTDKYNGFEGTFIYKQRAIANAK